MSSIIPTPGPAACPDDDKILFVAMEIDVTPDFLIINNAIQSIQTAINTDKDGYIKPYNDKGDGAVCMLKPPAAKTIKPGDKYNARIMRIGCGANEEQKQKTGVTCTVNKDDYKTEDATCMYSGTSCYTRNQKIHEKSVNETALLQDADDVCFASCCFQNCEEKIERKLVSKGPYSKEGLNTCNIQPIPNNDLAKGYPNFWQVFDGLPYPWYNTEIPRYSTLKQDNLPTSGPFKTIQSAAEAQLDCVAFLETYLLTFFSEILATEKSKQHHFFIQEVSFDKPISYIEPESEKDRLYCREITLNQSTKRQTAVVYLSICSSLFDASSTQTYIENKIKNAQKSGKMPWLVGEPKVTAEPDRRNPAEKSSLQNWAIILMILLGLISLSLIFLAAFLRRKK